MKEGNNIETKIVYLQKDDVFFLDLRTKVNEYFKRNRISKQDDKRMYFKTGVQILLWTSLYALMLSNYVYGLALFILQIAFQFSMFLMSVGIAHDGSHSSYSQNSRINKIMYSVFDLIGINSDMWEYNHNLSHHYVPNIAFYDSAIDSFGLFRFHPKAKYYWFHRYQHYYIFIIYAFATLFKLLFLDFFSLNRNQIGIVKIEKHSIKKIVYLIFTKCFVIFYTLIIPVLVIKESSWHIVYGFIAGHLVSGIALGIIFQVTHLSDNTIFVEPDENGIIYNSFSNHILKTTSDFAIKSKTVTWISGGLNMHVAHHLFPKISQIHLPVLTRIVKETAIVYAMPYKEYTSVFAAIRSHLKLLKKLGSKAVITSNEWPINANSNTSKI